jgi:DNA-binding MurR/RpiR family transcriptional regulator
MIPSFYAPGMPEPTLAERIAATDLAPAERRVAQFFAESGDRTSFLPAAKIAATLGVSTATVVRTAQRLGYAGLPELKDELRAAVLRRHPSAPERLEHSLDELTADPGALPASLFALEAGLLDEAAHTLRPADYVRAVDVLGSADRIVVFCQPPYGHLGDHFATDLRRYGRRVQVIGVRHGQLVEELLDVGPGDAFVLVAYDRPTAGLDLVLDRARERRAASVLITDTLALALKGRYTVALSAPRGAVDKQPTATVPLAVLEALQFGVSGYDRSRTLTAMSERERLRKRLS